MAVHLAEKRLSRTLGKMIQKLQMNAGTIVINYIDNTEPDGFDPNVESTYGTHDKKTARANALVHHVTARTVLRQFAEIQAGDAIVTFEGTIREVDEDGDETGNTIDLSALQQISFSINGRTYVQAVVGKDLAAYWSTLVGGNPLSQTLLLRLAS